MWYMIRYIYWFELVNEFDDKVVKVGNIVFCCMKFGFVVVCDLSEC